MRKSIVITSFLAVAAGAVGVKALNCVSTTCGGSNMLGSDTIGPVMDQYLAGVCANANITYVGTGSGSGETAMMTGASSVPTKQTIAPMSRFLNPASMNAAAQICPVAEPNGGVLGSRAEGIAFALDGVQVVGSPSIAGGAGCNGAAVDCSTTTDPNKGLAINTTVGTYTFGGGALGAANAWKDVLRIVYAGMDQNAGSTLTNQNCNSDLRKSIVNAWSNLFQDQVGCTTASCAATLQRTVVEGGVTRLVNCAAAPDNANPALCSTAALRHAFRRDDASGTTDVFLTLLGLPTINSALLNNNIEVSPFCNSNRVVAAGQYVPEFQDGDLIRRTCVGTGGGTTTAAEQVCAADGTLGLVLPVYPTDYLTDAQAFPTTACSTVMGRATAPQVITNASTGSLGLTGSICPNGDSLIFVNQCLAPLTSTGSFSCLATNGQKPLFTYNPSAVPGASADGRVYNLHLRNADGTYLADARARRRQIQGAFYRIHTNRTYNSPGNTASEFCAFRDATQQIGCLMTASPCSIGYAGRAASDILPGKTVASSVGLKVNLIDPAASCIRAGTYPMTRLLYINTLMGFGPSQSYTDAAVPAGANVNGNELSLVQCMLNDTYTNGPGGTDVWTQNGFFPLVTSGTNPAGPCCRDFDDTGKCGGAGFDACSDDVAGGITQPGGAALPGCGL